MCFLLALFFLVQFLGLLFIEGIADRAAQPDNDLRIPLSVRFVGLVADRLQQEVLDVPLDPDGSNWPGGFRAFFVLQLCGMAGLCIAMVQMGFGLLKRRGDWQAQARSILIGSCLAILTGVLLLKLIDPVY
jgi:hypothetical protein